jgi:hypothetical protein
MPRPGRDWTDAERIVVLDDYLQSLTQHHKLGSDWTRATSGLLKRSAGSVNYKLGNFIYARTEVLGLAKAGFKGRADRDKELLEDWHKDLAGLHQVASRLRESLGSIITEEGRPTPPATGRFYDWLKGSDRRTLEQESKRRREAARRRQSEGRTISKGEVRIREGQRDFKEAALIDFALFAGIDAMLSCPGCGHSRARLNGDPILEVHHVIPFSRTLAMDPRWGVPMCCNCHEVAHTGSVADCRAIYARVTRIYPQLCGRLRELREAGELSQLQAEELTKLGLDIS